MTRRTERFNSLLREVISEIIRKMVKNPHLPPLVTITHVEITKDLRHAKVYVSVIGNAKAKQEAVLALQSAAGFIGVNASKEVSMRYFPQLTFLVDDSVEKHMRVEELIHKIEKERESRE